MLRLKHYTSFVLLACVLLACGGGEDDPAPVVNPPLGPGEVAGYTKIDHEGFVIQVESNALANHPELTNRALDKVRTDLSAIVNDYELAGDVLEDLRQVPFFIDWSKTFGGAVEHHISLNWLINNGYIEEKLNSVAISNVNNFLHFTELNQPNMLLHELAHLYHQTKLTVNYEPIFTAFVNGRDSQIYDFVAYHTGNGNIIEGVASPAKGDQLNYFAELTEAYFGENDYFPFDRDDLAEHDPTGFQLLESIWK